MIVWEESNSFSLSYSASRVYLIDQIFLVHIYISNLNNSCYSIIVVDKFASRYEWTKITRQEDEKEKKS